MNKYKLQDPHPCAKPDFSDTVTAENKNRDDQDFNSNIAKYSLLKSLIINANLVHLDDFEVCYWHIINMKMLEEGLWSKYKFNERIEYQEFSELILMTALLAKKLCNTPEEYEIFEEFVFHNYEEVLPLAAADVLQPTDGEERAKLNKRKQKEEQKKHQK